jgi:hypothetical protein
MTTEAQGPFRILAVRSRASMFGAAEAWVKRDGEIVEFPTMAAAEAQAKAYNQWMRSGNVCYLAKAGG